METIPTQTMEETQKRGHCQSSMQVTINNIPIEFRYSIRGMMNYESAVKTLGGGDLTKAVYLLWAFVYAYLERTKQTDKVTPEQFLEWIDDNTEEFYTLLNWLTEELERQSALRDERMGGEEDRDGVAKKK